MLYQNHEYVKGYTGRPILRSSFYVKYFQFSLSPCVVLGVEWVEGADGWGEGVSRMLRRWLSLNLSPSLSYLRTNSRVLPYFSLVFFSHFTNYGEMSYCSRRYCDQ